METIIVLFAFPFAVAAGAWLGRKYQRHTWRLDLPYDERVKLLRRA